MIRFMWRFVWRRCGGGFAIRSIDKDISVKAL
jgi:hypothetical protein